MLVWRLGRLVPERTSFLQLRQASTAQVQSRTTSGGRFRPFSAETTVGVPVKPSSRPGWLHRRYNGVKSNWEEFRGRRGLRSIRDRLYLMEQAQRLRELG